MWFDKIREMKEQSGLSTKDVAEKSGIPEPTLEKLFAGTTKDPKLSTMRQLVHFFGYTLDDLEDWGNKKSPSITDEAMKLAKDFDRLDIWGKKQVRSTTDIELARCQDVRHEGDKVVDLFPARHFIQSASAGYGDFNNDSSYETIDLIKRPPAGMSFLITVDGDSMEPTFQDGDLLFVRAQETIQVGEIGLFAIAGHLYIKEAGEDGLISHNEAYETIYPPEDSPAKVEGKIIGICTPDYLQ